MKPAKILLLARAFIVFATASYSAFAAESVLALDQTLVPANTNNQAPKEFTSKTSQFSGFSLGMYGGIIHTSARSQYMYTNPIINSSTYPGYGGIETMSGNGGLIGFHAILGHVFSNKVYLGVETTAGYNFVRGMTRNDAYFGKYVTYQQKDSDTMALRMGALAGEALVYVKAGAALTRRTLYSRYSRLLVPYYSSTRYIPGSWRG